MRNISTTELAKLKATANNSMQDVCTVDALSVTTGSLGEEIKTYTSGSEISCGFDPGTGNERYKDQLLLNDVNTYVRLPYGTSISVRDRITIKSFYGQTLSPTLTFEITSEPLITVDSIRVQLKMVVV